MNVLELKQRLIDKTINVLNNDHDIDILDKIDKYIDDLKYRIESRLSSGDKESAQYIIDELNSDIVYNQPTFMHVRCNLCNNGYLNLRLQDNDNIILVDITTEKTVSCPSKKLIDNGKLETTINVSTGKLVLQNIFRKDELNRMPSYNSINDIVGINNLMQYLASTKDVGYIQLTNTDVRVYKRDNTIYICNYIDPDYIDIDDDNIYETCIFTDDEYLGYISCNVWRVMFADISVLESHNEDYDEDRIEVDIIPGRYIVENNYILYQEKRGILATIKLIV